MKVTAGQGLRPPARRTNKQPEVFNKIRRSVYESEAEAGATRETNKVDGYYESGRQETAAQQNSQCKTLAIMRT